jgi:hypothetical protein
MGEAGHETEPTIVNLDRGEYGLIYHQTFGKSAGREACRKGWERWQQLQTSDHGFIVLHPMARLCPRHTQATTGPLPPSARCGSWRG